MATTEGLCFFDLPAEIRNEIYRLTLEGTTTTISGAEDCDRRRQAIMHSTSSDGCVKGLPGILHTNRQVRSECSLLFYSTTQFVATSCRALVAWLSALEPEQRSSIEHFCHRVEMCRSFDASEVTSLLDLVTIDLIQKLKRSGLGFDYRVVNYEIWKERDWRGQKLTKVWPRK